MFGKGIYLADISSKSANYCGAELSGGTGLLLLAEAELGEPMYESIYANYDAPNDAKGVGAVATFGIGMTTPLAWKDAGCIHKDLEGVLMVCLVAKVCQIRTDDDSSQIHLHLPSIRASVRTLNCSMMNSLYTMKRK